MQPNKGNETQSRTYLTCPHFHRAYKIRIIKLGRQLTIAKGPVQTYEKGKRKVTETEMN